MVLQHKNITSAVSVTPTAVTTVIPSHSTSTLNVEYPTTYQVVPKDTNDQTITNIFQLEKELQSLADGCSAADPPPISKPSETQLHTNVSDITSSHQTDIIQEQLSHNIKLEDTPVPELIEIKEEISEISPIVGDTDTAISQVLDEDKPPQVINSNTETPPSIAVSTESPSVSTLDKTTNCYREYVTVAVLPLQSSTVVNSCGTQLTIPTSVKTPIHTILANTESIVQNDSIPGPSTELSVV